MSSVSQDSQTIYLVDDDASQLRALTRLIRSAGWSCSSFSSPSDFLNEVETEARGCLVLDFEMPEMNGLEVQKLLTESRIRLPIVFLTAHGDVPLSVRAMLGGAINFLCKPCEAELLLDAVGKALELDRKYYVENAEALEFARRLGSLTPREHEVVELVVLGRLNKQIAAQLGTGEKTIKVHRGRAMKKLGLAAVADLSRLYEQISKLNLLRK